MSMQVALVMFRADGEKRSFPLPRSIAVLGRREDCDLRIPLAEVSRKHCRLIADEDTLKLEDLGSSNGTYVNGQRVQEAMLNPGDTVTIGPVSFVVQINGVPAEEDIQLETANPNTDTSLAMPAEPDPDSEGSGEMSLENLDGLEDLKDEAEAEDKDA
jgi:pSer/pThr/pTyr-binding forkhead associated (FHA) protein